MDTQHTEPTSDALNLFCPVPSPETKIPFQPHRGSCFPVALHQRVLPTHIVFVQGVCHLCQGSDRLFLLLAVNENKS